MSKADVTFSPVLAGPEREQLVQWREGGDSRLVLRARIVLGSAAGGGAAAVARDLGVAAVTVYKWRARYAEHGLAGLEDRPRPGQPRKLSTLRDREIVRWTTERLPVGRARWSLRLLAHRVGVTEHQVRRIWEEHGLRPHLSRPVGPLADTGPAADRITLHALLLAPPYNAVVLSRPEAAARVATSDFAPRMRRRSGAAPRHEWDSLYAAHERALRTDVYAGMDRARSAELVSFIGSLEPEPETRELCLILSNEAVLEDPAFCHTVGTCPWLRIHAFPLATSWVAEHEGWMARQVARDHHGPQARAIATLRRALGEFVTGGAATQGRPFVWHAPAASRVPGRLPTPRALTA